MEGKPFHVFDGDGMVHAVSFSPSSNTFSYRNRWVRSKRLLSDARQRYSYAEIGEMDFIDKTGDFGALMNQVDPSSGGLLLSSPSPSLFPSPPPPPLTKGERMGKANTSLVVHAGMLLALVRFRQSERKLESREE